MKALVTGSAGFVGRHMCAALEARGYDLLRVDIAQEVYPREARDFFRRDDETFDLVVHLAALVGGRTRIEGDPLSLAVDLAIDADMFGWALRTRQRRVVYFSSSAAYPVRLQDAPCAGRTLEEDDIDLANISSPDLTYGWAKLTGEMLAGHARGRGVPVTVLRPFSGYGEDQSTDYPFPSFIERARRRDDPFVVWGDGTATRDFIHISDVVEATLAAVEGGHDGPLNLGTGRATSFNDLAALVCAEAGYSPAVEHLTDKPIGVHYRVADTTAMREVYTPKVELEDGIRRALA